ncbi:MAG: Dabb family protein [Bacteroidota bacterium]
METTAAAQLAETPDSLLRHLVLFSWTEATTAEKQQELTDAFAALPGQIPAIYDYEAGLNNSPEGLDKGFTHCFLVTFLSEADRAVYLPHPAHQAFVELIGPHVADVLVVDFWVANGE